MFAIAFLLGLVLWLHFHIAGGWLHVPLLLVALLLAYYIVSGRKLKRAAQVCSWDPPRHCAGSMSCHCRCW